MLFSISTSYLEIHLHFDCVTYRYFECPQCNMFTSRDRASGSMKICYRNFLISIQINYFLFDLEDLTLTFITSVN